MRAFAVLNTRNIYVYIVKKRSSFGGGFEEKKTRYLFAGGLCALASLFVRHFKGKKRHNFTRKDLIRKHTHPLSRASVREYEEEEESKTTTDKAPNNHGRKRCEKFTKKRLLRRPQPPERLHHGRRQTEIQTSRAKSPPG